MSPALIAAARVRADTAASRDHETVLRDLSAVMFSSLPRSDQRRTGEEYLHALLRAEGRKSFRKLAALSGTRANPQRLHHFISVSTWDWSAVRRDLIGYLARELPARAWVVRPLVTAESGRRCLRLPRCRGSAPDQGPTDDIEDAGRLGTARLAFGVWAACPAAAWPLGWRLRTQSDETDETTESAEDCLVRCVVELLRQHELPQRPVVVDVRGADATRIISRLRSQSVTVLARIPSSLELIPALPLQPGGRICPLPAQQILHIADTRRREICGSQAGSEVIGTVPVRLASGSACAQSSCGDAFVLLGIGPRGPHWPEETWISDLTTTPPPELYRLARLIRRVDEDFARFGDAAGLRDYAGRTSEGWYRHITLASAAYAILALGPSEG